MSFSSGTDSVVPSVPLEWADLWNAMNNSPVSWIPTTENMYWNMLEAVPPRAMFAGAFLVGEPFNHNAQGEPIYAMFRYVGNEYEARYMTLREFNEFKRIRSGVTA